MINSDTKILCTTVFEAKQYLIEAVYLSFFYNMDQYYTKVFWNEGLTFANSEAQISRLTAHRKFRSFYGVSPDVCAIIWTLIAEKPSGAQPKHLLWCLLFLKRYNTEHVNASIVKVDEKTFRLWTWTFIELISKLNVVTELLCIIGVILRLAYFR